MKTPSNSSPVTPPSLSHSSLSPPTASQSDRGFVQDIVLNIFEPGVNQSVIIFLNITFVLLLLTLVGLTVLVGFDLHILFLIVLAVGLMAGFNWYRQQLVQCDYLYIVCIHDRFIAQLPSGDSQSEDADRTKQD